LYPRSPLRLQPITAGSGIVSSASPEPGYKQRL
jgi:hypothetical protein